MYFYKKATEMQKYSGKRVYVTGGSSGIGLVIAVKFAALGADIAIFGRDSRKLEVAVTRIETAFCSLEQRAFCCGAACCAPGFGW